ncbi:hypothetical protein [Aestuariivirga litoralis]|uniref:hypothetical protein n=1 Tax=Aestuariivirga litoralis TaxID=2650924 RepID=UPI0018C6E00B|nr:hypothetical protein [Aestuariivirga litoralis]MBG1231033.1 hypothetical protein [Aestuariivirga litoralis]
MKFVSLAFLVMMMSATAANAACTASASRVWNGLTVEAVAAGPDCAKAVVTLTLRQSSGDPLWTRSFITVQLMNFSQNPASDGKSMTKTVKDWISGSGFMQTADKLVLDGEFPFDPSAEVDKATFTALRKAKAPLLCYVQGMESGNCLAIDKDGSVVELGIQRFPG